jgi:hypothetical protein
MNSQPITSASRPRTQQRKRPTDDAPYAGPSGLTAGHKRTHRDAHADAHDGGPPRVKRKRVDHHQLPAVGPPMHATGPMTSYGAQGGGSSSNAPKKPVEDDTPERLVGVPTSTCSSPSLYTPLRARS